MTFLKKHLRLLIVALVMALPLAGCGSFDIFGDDEADNAETEETAVEEEAEPTDTGTLALATGRKLTFDGMQCIYRQSNGSSNNLALQLQFLDEDNGVAFAAYLGAMEPDLLLTDDGDDPNEFIFEVFVDGQQYETVIEEQAMSVQLDDLPDPDTTRDGEVIELAGSLEIDAMILRASRGGQRLNIVEQSIPFACNTTFQRSEVLD